MNKETFLTMLAALRRISAGHEAHRPRLVERVALSLSVVGVLLFVSTQTSSAHIGSLIPNSVTAGGPGFTLRILGNDFDEGDAQSVYFDGQFVISTLISSEEIQASIPDSLISQPRDVYVTLDPTGESGRTLFTINPVGPDFLICPRDFSLDWRRQSVDVNVFQAFGREWTVDIFDNDWITPSITKGTGNGKVSLLISENLGSFRSGTITVAGKEVALHQGALGCPLVIIHGAPPITSGDCPSIPGAVNEDALTLSRRFRDDVLAQSTRGRRYTELYYQFSSEAVQMLLLNPVLILRSREMMGRYIPIIHSMVKGEPVTLTDGDLDEIGTFLNGFAEKGGPALRETIKSLCQDLMDPQVHREFNITIQPGPRRKMSAYGSLDLMPGEGLIFATLILLFLLLWYRSSKSSIKAGLKRSSSVALSLVLVAGPSFVARDKAGIDPPKTSLKHDKQKSAQAGGALGKLPLRFEINHGQTDPGVKFISRGAGYNLLLTPTEATLVFGKQEARSSENELKTDNVFESCVINRPRTRTTATDALRIKLVGANADARISGLDGRAANANYFLSVDVANWRANVPTYSRVISENIYEGVDLIYYGNQQNLEYDFKLAPGAEPGAIRLGFEGAEAVGIDSGGELVIRMTDAEVRQRKPLAYQEINGTRRSIPCRYSIRDRAVEFELGPYDHGKPLIIDPVLGYSTYFGGGGTEEGNSIAVDSAGNVYIAGFTDSLDFPLRHSAQSTLGGGQQDAFVAKLDPTGTRLLYSTYIGGDGQDNATGIAVDAAGNAFITGFTGSTNFPVRNPLQPAKKGAFNAFVVKLDPGGSLVNSTLFGGSSTDYASSIAIDSSGNIYFAGVASSTDLPIVNAIQSTRGGLVDSYVAKIDPSGSRLIYSTYLGGAGLDGISGIAVDSAGSIYLAGLTSSRNFRVANPLQPSHGGGMFDAFVTKLNPSATQIVYSTYLGGVGSDRALRIAVDSTGNAYVTGDTDSANFPLANAAQQAMGGSSDAFAAKLNPSGTQLIYSTYLGGSGIEGGTAIGVDRAGRAYVAGFTSSQNFPIVNAVQPAFGGGYDGFVAQLSASGTTLDFSSYVGGSGVDSIFGMSIGSGGVYVMGITDSSNFPTANPIQAMNAGGAADLFIVRINATPFVTGAMPDGKRLIVSGSGFEDGAKILIDGEKQKTANDSQTPGKVLIGKKAAKAIKPGATVTLQVRNPDGSLSNEFRYTRP